MAFLLYQGSNLSNRMSILGKALSPILLSPQYRSLYNKYGEKQTNHQR
ncbi:hypothetical protein HMPREF1254_0333 [Prevotella sp. BV3P1]|nr:hypothetical protein HMPREF1254_0333 [Prevotella sp. BV3P1]